MVGSYPVALAVPTALTDLMCVEAGLQHQLAPVIEAGAPDGSRGVAVSNLDETDLVCCAIARRRAGTIARCGIRTGYRRARPAKREIQDGHLVIALIWRRFGRSPPHPQTLHFPPWSQPRRPYRRDRHTGDQRPGPVLRGGPQRGFHPVSAPAEVLIARRRTIASSPTALCAGGRRRKLYTVGTVELQREMLRAMGRHAPNPASQSHYPCWGRLRISHAIRVEDWR